jgi:tRNA modification GTPase
MIFKAGDEDTICALSTAPGLGGIAVIRVSGRNAAAISRKICRFLPAQPESHRVYYGLACSADKKEEIDEVLVTFFKEGRSFTGEETIEISCHGSPVTSSWILKELVDNGARSAQPGEFTFRAFMSGRIDLVQAESVLGLIESQSKQSAKMALRQLQGRLSVEFARIEDDLVWLLAHLEASIDFSAEGIEVVPSQHLQDRSRQLMEAVAKLIGTYRDGRVLREGLEIALVGRPNAGKSSLLNAFLREDRAIVTPHAGTTRDTVEGKVSIGGMGVTFVDTAGIRETDNEIEKIGISRSRAAMEKADFVFYVVDPGSPDLDAEILEYSASPRPRDCYIVNKSDLDSKLEKFSRIREVLKSRGVVEARIFSISSLTRDGLERVESCVLEFVKELDSGASNVVMQARHFELLQKIHSCLDAALRLIKQDSSPEFIAFELQEAVRAVHDLLGKEFNEQVIDRIFREFCLGK